MTMEKLTWTEGRLDGAWFAVFSLFFLLVLLEFWFLFILETFLEYLATMDFLFLFEEE